MNFLEKVIETITNPKNAMKSIAEQPMIEEAVMIVGISAAIGALGAYIRSYKLVMVLEGFENMPASMQSITAIIGVVGALIGAFTFWLIGTGIIHLISMALGGEGKFHPQMLTVAGYSMIPFLFSSILSAALLSAMEPVTLIVSATNPVIPEGVSGNPYIIASGIAGIIFQIWGAAILFFGVQSAQKLSAGRSAIAVGIPFAAVIIPAIWSFSIL